MAELTPQYSTNRMLREYVDRLYLTAARKYHKRTADGANEAVRLYRWRESLEAHWQKLHFGSLDVQSEGEDYTVAVGVYLDALAPKAIQVQLYAEPQGSGGPEIHVMKAVKAAGTTHGLLYRVRITALRPVEHYTPRIIPHFEGAAVPLEVGQILWYESSSRIEELS